MLQEQKLEQSKTSPEQVEQIQESVEGSLDSTKTEQIPKPSSQEKADNDQMTAQVIIPDDQAQQITPASSEVDYEKKRKNGLGEQTLDLIRFTVEQLGFSEETTIDEIYQKAEQLGLELRPAEVDPQLGLQNISKEWILVSIKASSNRASNKGVFYLNRFSD